MSSMITLNLMFLNSESSRIWAYLLLIVCLAISAAVAYLISRVTELGIIVSGVAGGFFLAFLMNYLIFWRIDSSPSWLFLNCLIVYFCVLGGILGRTTANIAALKLEGATHVEVTIAGRWGYNDLLRTAESVVLTPCPPGPDARYTSIWRSDGSISTSISSASAMTSTVADDVWIRP